MSKIGLATAAIGTTLAFESLMMQFLGVADEMLTQMLWIHAAIVAVLLAAVVHGVSKAADSGESAWSRLWEAVPGLI